MKMKLLYQFIHFNNNMYDIMTKNISNHVNFFLEEFERTLQLNDENSESYKVHIVILTWNNKILKRCLESIENVDHKNFTISVIDNNSSDDSLK